jgi:AbrB family looped-hinge helix DNA binding protein
MKMPRLTQKGQVTVPKEIRNKLGIKRGDDVEFIIKDGECLIKKKKVINIDKWVGFLGRGNTDEFIDEIRGGKFDDCG